MPANDQSTEDLLRSAAVAALAAPSIFNTQPWRWQVGPTILRLWADRDRQLLVADPQARLLTISCGVALHHARLALAASGHQAIVHRPDQADSDLLATIELAGPHQPTAAEVNLYQAISRRRTDRRAFDTEPVSEDLSQALVAAAEAQGAHLHIVRREQIAVLALAAAQAGVLQLSNSEYRMELIRWTHRPPWRGAASNSGGKHPSQRSGS